MKDCFMRMNDFNHCAGPLLINGSVFMQKAKDDAVSAVIQQMFRII
ncbi:hypothetical protein SDC9_156551 [bioreactor metagenome]|uniref:Uncharacterized protein n=1 Tax=bioreactor metagenome TaxID=1076179 RepID=A0A645F6V8_9ZZZZ